ncbi:hypothetical protein D3C72_2316150 [compost metagenome]
MNIGKPYEGKPHVRFDEEGLVRPALYSSGCLDACNDSIELQSPSFLRFEVSANIQLDFIIR